MMNLTDDEIERLVEAMLVKMLHKMRPELRHLIKDVLEGQDVLMVPHHHPDPIDRWLTDRQIVSADPNSWVSTADLWTNWLTWAQQNGITRQTRTWMTRQLRARHFKYERGIGSKGQRVQGFYSLHITK